MECHAFEVVGSLSGPFNTGLLLGLPWKSAGRARIWWLWISPVDLADLSPSPLRWE